MIMETWLFELLDISNWANFWWIVVGLTAQAIFAARFLVQWIASERAGRSYVPVAFWYISIVGGLMLLSYAIWRQDIVFILGQMFGVVVYARNLVLIHKSARADAAEAARREQEAADAAHR
jgi:lipid-A-disaccharide synthase-like uncharacterized protein